MARLWPDVCRHVPHRRLHVDGRREPAEDAAAASGAAARETAAAAAAATAATAAAADAAAGDSFCTGRLRGREGAHDA